MNPDETSRQRLTSLRMEYFQNSTVYMVKTTEMTNYQKPICFAETYRRSASLWGWDDDSYCIWSCRFSADGNEVRVEFYMSPEMKRLSLGRLLLEGEGKFSVSLDLASRAAFSEYCV